MVECPSCGAEVTAPVKSWPVSFKKQGEEEAKPQFIVGIFECPACKSKFRSRVESSSEHPEMSSGAGLVERINSIREGFNPDFEGVAGEDRDSGDRAGDSAD